MSANQSRSAALKNYHTFRRQLNAMGYGKNRKRSHAETVSSNDKKVDTSIQNDCDATGAIASVESVFVTDTSDSANSAIVQDENYVDCDVDLDNVLVEQSGNNMEGNDDVSEGYSWGEDSDVDEDVNIVSSLSALQKKQDQKPSRKTLIRTRSSYQDKTEESSMDLGAVLFSGVEGVSCEVDDAGAEEDAEMGANVEGTTVDCSEFNLLKVVYYDLLEASRNYKHMDDAHQPIFPGVSTTKAECAEHISSFCAVNSIKRQHRDAFLKLMFSMTEGKLDLPVTITPKLNVLSKIEKYSEPDWRSKQFHICKKGGCCVFIGENLDLKFCPYCKFPRYTQCNCGRPIADCICDSSSGVPRRILQYRSLISLIHELLRYKAFWRTINCSYTRTAGKVRDILDSFDAKQSLVEMHDRYIATNAQATEVSLLFANFYDGTQPYKRSQQNFWPCLFSILNLPPSYRTRLGVGTFMISLFTGTMDSASEVFLFRDLIVGELLKLENGILLEVSGIKYFVQARCPVFTFDTPAYSKVMKVQSANSSAGCPVCYHGKGVNFPCYGSSKYFGIRRLLPLDHFLRKFGQSGQCCPPGYYEYCSSSCNDKDQWMRDIFCKVPAVDGEIKNVCMSSTLVDNLKPCCALKDHSKEPSLKEFLRKIVAKHRRVLKYEDVNHSWFHMVVGGVSMDYLESYRIDLYRYLYYHHADYRDYENYRIKVQDDMVELDRVRREKQLKEYKGVKGLPEMVKLRSFLSHKCVHFDPWHTLENIASYFLDNLAGKRDYSACAEYMRQSQCHPDIWKQDRSNEKKGKAKNQNQACAGNSLPCWVAPGGSLFEIEANLNAVIYPVGMSKDFQIKSIFTKAGLLRGTAKVRVLTTFLRLIVSLTKIPLAYKFFAFLLQDDVAMLLAPEISEDDGAEILNKTVELLALWEGLFPISESNFVQHQLLHIGGMVESLGPLKGIWAASGERNVGFIKSTTNKGGVGVEVTVQKNYGAFERATIANAYSSDPRIEARETSQKIQGDINNSDCVSFYGDKMEYDEYQSFLRKRDKTNFELSEFEKKHLLEALYVGIHTDAIANDQHAILAESAFYRLCSVYKRHLASRFDDIHSWMEYVHNYGAIGQDEMEIMTDLITDSLNTLNKVQKCDIKIATEILSFNIRSYEDALVNGLWFHGRGRFCREDELGTMLVSRYGEQVVGERKRYPANPANFLNEHWSDKRDSSSWMMAFDYGSKKDFFCQFNFGLRFRSSDPIVSGQRVLSIVKRRHKYGSDQVFRIKADEFRRNRDTSFDHTTIFIPIQAVYSMPILILGNDDESRPIMTKYFDGDGVIKAEIKFRKKYYSTSNTLDHLCVLPGKPERRVLNVWRNRADLTGK